MFTLYLYNRNSGFESPIFTVEHNPESVLYFLIREWSQFDKKVHYFTIWANGQQATDFEPASEAVINRLQNKFHKSDEADALCWLREQHIEKWNCQHNDLPRFNIWHKTGKWKFFASADSERVPAETPETVRSNFEKVSVHIRLAVHEDSFTLFQNDNPSNVNRPRTRSLSVGDVVENVETGDFWELAYAGYERLN